jgi:hypothetical protein
MNEPIAVSLEDLVPADHFYRHLEAKRGLGRSQDWTRDLYAARGRPSIDAVVFSRCSKQWSLWTFAPVILGLTSEGR